MTQRQERRGSTSPQDTTSLLEQYPAVAGPLPVSWDGADVVWSSWSAMQVFICGGTRSRKRQVRCDQCGYAGTTSLSVRGTVDDPPRTLMLSRCPNCARDTVVDWHQEVWILDEDDYGPDGSWDEFPTLFDTSGEELDRG